MRTAIVDGSVTSELRRAVLRPSWPVGSAMHGDDDPSARHVAAFDDAGTVLGACVVLPRAYPPRPDEPGAWQLRGMATAAGHRSQGVGAAVLAAAIAEIARQDGRVVWCDARTSAVRFYARHGFVAEGPEFIQPETGLPHYRMWRAVPAPDLLSSP